MLIPLQQLKEKYNLQLTGVIQIGCHWAEEHEEHILSGISKFVYIEPCKDAFVRLENMFVHDSSVILFNVACGNSEGHAEMFVSNQNQGQSNSLLAPQKHLIEHPEIVFNEREVVSVKKLDNLEFDRGQYNFLSMDCQGFEGVILKGATETLKHIDYIMTEVNRDTVYENNVLIEGIDELLSEFTRVETHWASANLSWGDAVYIRTSKL